MTTGTYSLFLNKMPNHSPLLLLRRQSTRFVTKICKPPPQRNWVEEFQLDTSKLHVWELKELCELFDEYADVCSSGDHDLRHAIGVEHYIDTADTRPIKQPLRRINPAQRPVVDQKINEMPEQ